MKYIVLLTALLAVGGLAAAGDPAVPSSDFGSQLAAAAPTPVAASAADREAVKAILKGIHASMGAKGGVSAANCPKAGSEKWLALVLVGTPIPLNLVFQKNCDVQGKLVIDRKPFPFELQLRHLKGIDRVKAVMTPQVIPDLANKVVRVSILTDKGTLFSSKEGDVLGFSSEYHVAIGLDGKPAAKPTGEIHVTRFHGRPVDVKEVLQFD